MIDILPDDENGQVLKRMLEGGDDLSKPRYVDFTVVFQNEGRAFRFAELIQDKSWTVSIKRSGTLPELPWDVTVSSFMVPTHKGISQLENELEQKAIPLGGRNDGWGCFDRKGTDH